MDMRSFGRIALVLLASLGLASCGVNTVPTKEEAAKAQWGVVQSAYQRRADLIPNLVETVKAAAGSENQIAPSLATTTSLGEFSETPAKWSTRTVTSPVLALRRCTARRPWLHSIMSPLPSIARPLVNSTLFAKTDIVCLGSDHAMIALLRISLNMQD